MTLQPVIRRIVDVAATGHGHQYAVIELLPSPQHPSCNLHTPAHSCSWRLSEQLSCRVRKKIEW